MVGLDRQMMAEEADASSGPPHLPEEADNEPSCTSQQLVPEWLQAHRLSNTLPSVLWIPEYLPIGEEERLLQRLRGCSKWTQLSGRRLQNYGGTVHAKGLIAARLPDWLEPLLAKLHADTRAFGAGPPNHVLVNAYQPGEGIMAHQDGPLYHPGVCIVSCGAPAVIRFRRKLDDAAATSAAPPALSVLLLPRSLLVFADEAYTGCLHSIDFTDTEVIDASVANAAACGFQAGDRLPRGGERISLTVRRVCKVFSNLLKLK